VVEVHGIRLTTRLHQGPQLHHQRPAVDELFYSLAHLRGVPIVAALLTGMGADGADGLLALRNAGAETIARMNIRASCSACHARRLPAVQPCTWRHCYACPRSSLMFCPRVRSHLDTRVVGERSISNPSCDYSTGQ